METKGQITLFVIIMIVIAIVVGFFFYTLSTGQESKMESEKKEETQQFLEKRDIKNSLNSCFDEAWTNSLEVIGRQAGFIYEDQTFETSYGDFTLEGNFNNEDRIMEYDGENYTILMTTPSFLDYDTSRSDSYYESKYTIADPQPIPAIEPPIYPCKPPVKTTLPKLGSFNLDLDTHWSLDDPNDMADCHDKYEINQSIRSFTNRTELPTLCNREYPNPSGGVLCDCVGGECENSTQSIMESFTKKYFKKCFNSVYENDSYEVRLDDLEINTMMAKKNLQTSINSTINATSKDGSEQLTFSQVNSQQKDIKLVALMEYFLEGVLKDDSRVISYDLPKNFKNLSREFKYSQNAKAKIEEFSKDGEDYTLVTLEIDASNRDINGEPFRFSFIREDRPPALSSITKSNTDPSTLHASTDERFNMTFCGADPDEDTVQLSLEGLQTGSNDASNWNFNKNQCSTSRENCECWEVDTGGVGHTTYNVKAQIKDSNQKKDWQIVDIKFN